MKEKTFQSLVIKALKDIGAFTINIEGLSSGLPDIVACVNGMFVGIELKVGTKYKATPLQLAQLAKIEKSGGMGMVLTYSEDWLDVLKKSLYERF